jgi:hypothetical protein
LHVPRDDHVVGEVMLDDVRAGLPTDVLLLL